MKISNYKVMVEGNVTAQALVSAKPLSFWGGVEPSTGMIKDVHHDLCGENLTGKVLCIPFDRGSCSGSGVLFEMIRQETAPAAILCIVAEAVLALGPVIGQKIYDRNVPIRTINQADYEAIEDGTMITFTEDAIIVGK